MNNLYIDDIQFAAYLYKFLFSTDKWIVPVSEGSVEFHLGLSDLKKDFIDAKSVDCMNQFHEAESGKAPKYYIYPKNIQSTIGYIVVQELNVSTGKYITLDLNIECEIKSNENVSNIITWLDSLYNCKKIRYFIKIYDNIEPCMLDILRYAFENNITLVDSTVFRTLMFFDRDSKLPVLDKSKMMDIIPLINSNSIEDWIAFKKNIIGYQIKPFIQELVFIIYNSLLYKSNTKKRFIVENLFYNDPFLKYLFFYVIPHKNIRKNDTKIGTLHEMLKFLDVINVKIDKQVFQSVFLIYPESCMDAEINTNMEVVTILEVVNILKKGGVEINGEQIMNAFGLNNNSNKIFKI